jgi:predicted metal-dependent hydrolase
MYVIRSGAGVVGFFARRRSDPEEEQFEVSTEYGVVAIDLRRHPRARNYTLRVGGPARPPVLTMPKRGTLSEARRFLGRHSGWLRSQIERLPPATAIAEGQPFPLRGVLYTIGHDPKARGTVTIAGGENDPALIVAGDPRHLRRRLLDYMKREARKDLEWAVLRHSLAIGVRPRAIRLRDQTSRWGSCSPDGHLSFSWRLIMCPPFVLDYLAAHEVAHLREPNHSHRFWQLCESLCPHTAAARRWLSHNGPALHAIGANG